MPVGVPQPLPLCFYTPMYLVLAAPAAVDCQQGQEKPEVPQHPRAERQAGLLARLTFAAWEPHISAKEASLPPPF